MATEDPTLSEVETRDCIVVGGGPAGVVLSYLLARAGLKVVLLEAAKDFDRGFRGDTLTPLALTLLDEMGLIEEILAMPHSKVDTLRAAAAGEDGFVFSYARLHTRYPYVMVLSQPIFLNFLLQKAAQYPNFDLRMRAKVTGLLEESGVVRGVRYRDVEGTTRELRAPLTVGADGRSSVVRKLSGLKTTTLTRTPDEVIWFKLPLEEGDPEEGLVAREDERSGIFTFRRPDEWQVSLTTRKGSYRELRERGIGPFRQQLSGLLPGFVTRLEVLEWDQTALLKVELRRAERWHREGLLLIGDAAHVMSPLGGVGINLAIRDAVVAANVLVGPLRRNAVTEADLAKVQRKLGWEVRLTQNLQAFAQNQGNRDQGDEPKRKGTTVGFPAWALNMLLNISAVRDLPVRFLAFGLVPVHLSRSLRPASEP